jgi:hypothetical protein
MSTTPVTEALRRIERALGTAYPASFYVRLDELAALTATPGFQRAFPATRLLLDIADVRHACRRSGGRLLPFMYSAAEQPDFYAFEPDGGQPEPRVVVWCVHTTVQAWPSFTQFMLWVRERSGCQ